MTQLKKPVRAGLRPIAGAFTIFLYSDLACQLLSSLRPRRGRPYGYLPFCRHVYRLWTAAKEDDPFAEQCLLYLWQALLKGQATLKDWHHKLLQEIKKQPVEILTHPLQLPIQHTFQSRTPYEYPAICLIKYFDEWISLTLIAEQIGLLETQQAKRLRDKAKLLVRHTLSRGSAWRYTGVTRQDVIGNTLKAQEVSARLGAVDERILNKQLRAPFIKTTSPRKNHAHLSSLPI